MSELVVHAKMQVSEIRCTMPWGKLLRKSPRASVGSRGKP